MLEVDQVIDNKYRIVRLIGAGGMGEVYEGENTRIRRRVAIKVLHATAAKNSEAVERFEREAQAAGRIGSDHILEVLDLGTLASGECFIVMEFLEGETLGTRVENQGRLTPQEAYPIIRQALVGLQAAHGAGIIHRDLKPDNIFICKERAGRRDFVKLIDFGISKFQTATAEMSKTRTGAVMGTPYYMSPEQAKGSREVDHRSDLYAMGVILFETVSAKRPFEGETFNELLFKIVLSNPPLLVDLVPGIDKAFESIVYKAMAREVPHRFQSAAAFIEALDRWAQQGASVTIPPEIGHDSGEPAAGPVQAAAPAVTAGVAGAGPATGAAWSTTDSSFAIPKSNRGLWIGGAVIGVLLAAGAFGVYRMSSSRPAPGDNASNATPAVSATAEAEQPPAPPSAPAETAPTAEPTAEASAAAAKTSEKPAEVAGAPRPPPKPIAKPDAKPTPSAATSAPQSPPPAPETPPPSPSHKNWGEWGY